LIQSPQLDEKEGARGRGDKGKKREGFSCDHNLRTKVSWANEKPKPLGLGGNGGKGKGEELNFYCKGKTKSRRKTMHPPKEPRGRQGGEAWKAANLNSALKS